MRALLISARADHGGGPQHLLQQAEILARTIDVFIACPREEPYWTRFEKVVGVARMLEIPHRAFRPGPLRALAALVRRKRIDVVHSHGFGAGLYGRTIALLTGRCAIHTAHGITPAVTVAGWVKLAADWLLSLGTARIIAVSSGEAVDIRQRSAFPSRVVVINNGVKLPAAPIDASVLPERPLRVVHVTRFVAQKNPELFVAVMERVRDAGAIEDFRFVFMGDGPDRPRIEEMIAARGLTPYVEFLGAIGAVAAQYQRAFCIFSTSRWEGMPLALLEANAFGVPTVATDVVGNRDAVADGVSGVLFDAASPAEGARLLIELSRFPERWMALSRSARQRTESDFSEERMVAETLSVYRAELGQSASLSPSH